MEGFGWDWNDLWRAVHGEQATGGKLCRGGGALVKQGGDGRAWKLCWGEGKVGGCLIWAGFEWRGMFHGELKARR